MANREQRPEFLGGGPKFNAVGRDTRGAGEPAVAPRSRLGPRVALIGAVIVLLAALLFYLGERTPGRTVVRPARGGRAASPEVAKPTGDPNLR